MRLGTGGAFTGSFADHPATGGRVPIYVAKYMVATYGTGAVMGVPAHAIFPDHLEVTVNGAPRLNVTLDEVGLKGEWWQSVVWRREPNLTYTAGRSWRVRTGGLNSRITRAPAS